MPVRNIILFFFLLAGLTARSQNEKWKAWETEGDTLLNRKDFEGALKLYSKVIDDSKLKDKSVYPAVYKRAVCYYSLNDFDAALKDLDIVIPEFPEMYQARLLRAFVHKEKRDSEPELLDLNEVLKIQPSNPDLLKWRASIYIEKSDYPLAKRDLLNAKAIRDDPETEMYLGSAHYYLGQADSALLSLNKAIELDVTFMPAYLYAGSFCLQEEEFDLALKYLNVALRVEPNNTTALFYKGIALVELKREKEGCSCLTKAFYAGEDDAGDYLKEYCFGIDN